MLIGDCNPDSTFHWIYLRFMAVTAELSRHRVRLRSLHKDNPYLWDEILGEWTEAGISYMEGLRLNTSGLRKRRLYHGEWCAAEGVIYDCFDPDIHVIDGRTTFDKETGRWFLTSHKEGLIKSRFGVDALELTWFVAGMDWGYQNPGVFQVWGITRDGRCFLVEEVYHSEKNDDWWIEVAFRPMAEKYPIWRVFADPANASGISLANEKLTSSYDGCAQVEGADKEPGSVKAGLMLVHGMMAPESGITRGSAFLSSAST